MRDVIINYTQKIKPDKTDIFTEYISNGTFPFSRLQFWKVFNLQKDTKGFLYF